MKPIDRYYHLIINAYSSEIEGCKYKYYVDPFNMCLIRLFSYESLSQYLVELLKLNIEGRRRLLKDYIANRANKEPLRSYLIDYLNHLNTRSDLKVAKKRKDADFKEETIELDLFFDNKLMEGALKEYSKFRISEGMEIKFCS